MGSRLYLTITWVQAMLGDCLFICLFLGPTRYKTDDRRFAHTAQHLKMLVGRRRLELRTRCLRVPPLR